MVKVRGAKDIIVCVSRVKIFDHAHISLEPRLFLHQQGYCDWESRGLLAAEQAVSQVEQCLLLFIHEISCDDS